MLKNHVTWMNLQRLWRLVRIGTPRDTADSTKESIDCQSRPPRPSQTSSTVIEKSFHSSLSREGEHIVVSPAYWSLCLFLLLNVEHSLMIVPPPAQRRRGQVLMSVVAISDREETGP